MPAPVSATLQLPQADTCAKFDHHIHDRGDGLRTPIRTNLVTCTPRQRRSPFMRQENCTRHAGSSEPCRSYSKGSLEDGPSATELTSSAQSRLNKRTSNRESSPQILCQLFEHHVPVHSTSPDPCEPCRSPTMPGLTTSIMKRTPHLHFRTNLVTQYPTPGSRWNRPPGRTNTTRSYPSPVFVQRTRPPAVEQPAGAKSHRPPAWVRHVQATQRNKDTLKSSTPVLLLLSRFFHIVFAMWDCGVPTPVRPRMTIRSSSPFVMRPRKHKFQ